MSKHAKLLNYLQSGKEVTAKQIKGVFGLAGPQRAVQYLREQGFAIYANTKTYARTGETVTKYRLGKPSRKMVGAAYRAMGASLFTRTAD